MTYLSSGSGHVLVYEGTPLTSNVAGLLFPLDEADDWPEQRDPVQRCKCNREFCSNRICYSCKHEAPSKGQRGRAKQRRQIRTRAEFQFRSVREIARLAILRKIVSSRYILVNEFAAGLFSIATSFCTSCIEWDFDAE